MNLLNELASRTAPSPTPVRPIAIDADGRLKPSSTTTPSLMVVKFTLLTRDVSGYLMDRYSERQEETVKGRSAPQLECAL